MEDRDYQISNLQRIFGEARLSPVLRSNPKYKVDGVARIGYDDIMDYKCVIKSDIEFPNSGGFWSGKGATVIVKYNSIEELVDDGWRMD